MPVIASNGSFLIKPGIGLMIWTLLVFGFTMILLSKLAFPRISEALERRKRTIEESIDTAERTRTEADELLAEYRERLKEARAQAEEIVQRARQTADSHEHEAKERSQEIIDEVRKEVADLTIMATEKVTRKTLTDADQKRLVDEALNELDFSSISSAAPNN
jgi:F-type H+-transporting ATPase subunit b